MLEVIDQAVVEVIPDLKKFTPDLKRQLDTAFRGARQPVERATKDVEQAVQRTTRSFASGAALASDTIRRTAIQTAATTKTSFVGVEQTSRTTAQRVGASFAGLKTTIAQHVEGAVTPVRSAVGRIGTAVGEIRSRVGEVGSHFRRLGDAGSGALGRIDASATIVTARIGALRVAVRFAALGAATALGAIGVAAAGVGVKTLAMQENAQIGFETLVGGARQAQKVLKFLFDFAKLTPFELPQVQQAAQLLLGAGLRVKDLNKALLALGNAASVTTTPVDTFGRATLALSQAMNKGKLQGEEILQFVEAGIPLWRLLAEATGKPIPELQKLSQQGKLLTADVLPKLFAQMNKDYGGAMARQSQTITGLWSTFMDTLNFGLADVIRPFEGELKTALAGAIESVSVVTRRLAGRTQELHDRIQELKARIPDLWQRFREGAAAARTVLDRLGGVSGALRSITAGSLALAAVRIGAIFGPWGVLAGIVAGAIVFLTVRVHGVRDAATSLWRFLQTNLGPVFSSIAGLIQRFVVPQLHGLQSAWRDNGGAIRQLLSGPLAGLLRILGVALVVVLNVVVRNITAVITIIGALARAVNFLWRNVVAPATRFIANAFLTMADVIVHSAATAFGWLPVIGDKLKGAARAFDRFKGDVNRALANIRDQSVSVTATANLKLGGFTKDLFNSVARLTGRAGGGQVQPGEVTLVGERGPELVHLPEGSYVHTAERTRNLRARGMQRGGSVGLDILPHGRGIRQVSAEARHVQAESLATARLLARGILAGIGQYLLGAGLGAGAGAGGPGGGNLGRWILQAIAITGVPLAWAAALRRRALFESGGNPLAINLTDINAQLGHPSKGLMQTIDATFSAYAFDGLRNIWNPVHNLVAAIRYILARYGTIFAIDPPVRGYQRGLWRALTDRVGLIHRDEMVVPAGPAGALRAAVAGGGGATVVNVREGAVQLVFNGPVDAATIPRVRREIDDAFRELLRLITAR